MNGNSNEINNDYSTNINGAIAAISQFAQVLSETYNKFQIPKIKINPDVLLGTSYIMALRDLKYPLFLETDMNFKREIVKYKNNGNDIQNVINEYINDDYLNNMLKQWHSSSCINKERLPIFEEAIELHRKKYYYACTSMLMCQVYGVIIDIYKYIDKNDVVIDDESKARLAKEYNMTNIDSEKGKFIQMTFITDMGYVIKEVIVEYFKNEILSSSESTKRWKNQPLRNKICHGDQLNFGTKEHSLKAILCINLLIKLGEYIKIVVNDLNKNEN